MTPTLPAAALALGLVSVLELLEPQAASSSDSAAAPATAR